MSVLSWPNQAAMNAFYGNPDANRDGSPDPSWSSTYLTTIIPPYPMVLAWDANKDGKLNDPVRAITVNKKCAADLLAILHEIKTLYPDQAALEAAGMHLFGGVNNFRVKRGGSGLSIHSWAAAIDLDPARNGFGDSTPAMDPRVVAIFERHGWMWGGRWKKCDGMHFQAASI